MDELGIKTDGFIDKIAGINHMGWLLEVTDLAGNDLYPEIKNEQKRKTVKKSMAIW